MPTARRCACSRCYIVYSDIDMTRHVLNLETQLTALENYTELTYGAPDDFLCRTDPRWYMEFIYDLTDGLWWPKAEELEDPIKRKVRDLEWMFRRAKQNFPCLEEMEEC